jgi:hypothetical protein
LTHLPAGVLPRAAVAVRANPAYRLCPFDQAPARLRSSVENGGVDPAGVFAFLLPRRGHHLPHKVVDASAADLFADFALPTVPSADQSASLFALVLDGVFEMAGPSGFVSGPQAFADFGPVGGVAPPSDRLGLLSRAALRYADRLGLDDPGLLTSRLYAFHRIPVSRRWRLAYPGPQAVLDLLPRRSLGALMPDESRDMSPWLHWSLGPGRKPKLPYKLYVSPRPECLPDVLPTAVETLIASGVTRFKIGVGAAGLLRPDKIVAYLPDARSTAGVAKELRARLYGKEAHGVPFSAELALDGLISWGGDPPPEAAPVGRRAESWRISVCRRLAEAVVVARRAANPMVSPVDYALARLSLDGVDVGSFAPTGLDVPRL